MQMVLTQLENDVDIDAYGNVTQEVVLHFQRNISGPSTLSDLTPIQALINRFVDVQISDARSNPDAKAAILAAITAVEE